MLSSCNRHSSLVHEQSLRRSFMAIHHPDSPLFEESKPRPSPISNNEKDTGNQEGAHTNSRGRNSKNRTHNRQATCDDCAVPPPLPSQRRAITPPVSSNDLPTLPFADEKQRQYKGKLSREHSPAKRFQRRSSTAITADMAQDMVTKLAKEKRRERRASVITQLLETTNLSRQVSDEQQQHRGFRNDYSLGETLRCSSHVILSPSSQAISSLQLHDFAFIKRSDESYSYAILACRSLKKNKGGNGMEECMTFVVDDAGSTKAIRQRHWNQFIRLVYQPLKQIPAFCQEVLDESEDTVPEMVAFDPEEVFDEECSLISSVSDRARLIRRR